MLSINSGLNSYSFNGTNQFSNELNQLDADYRIAKELPEYSFKAMLPSFYESYLRLSLRKAYMMAKELYTFNEKGKLNDFIDFCYKINTSEAIILLEEICQDYPKMKNQICQKYPDLQNFFPSEKNAAEVIQTEINSKEELRKAIEEAKNYDVEKFNSTCSSLFYQCMKYNSFVEAYQLAKLVYQKLNDNRKLISLINLFNESTIIESHFRSLEKVDKEFENGSNVSHFRSLEKVNKEFEKAKVCNEEETLRTILPTLFIEYLGNNSLIKAYEVCKFIKQALKDDSELIYLINFLCEINKTKLNQSSNYKILEAKTLLDQIYRDYPYYEKVSFKDVSKTNSIMVKV